MRYLDEQLGLSDQIAQPLTDPQGKDFVRQSDMKDTAVREFEPRQDTQNRCLADVVAADKAGRIGYRLTPTVEPS